MNEFFKNKNFLYGLAGVLVGAILVISLNAPVAKANFFQNLWDSFISPFENSTSTSSLTASSTSVYQSTSSYEQAIIDAVKKASPAVVAITVSKYVSVIEQCPYDPFSNLPPEFQQFFGNQKQQFYQPCDSGKKQLQEVGGGSGFIISSDGLILTNKHVVSDTSASYTVFLNDGRKFTAKVLARDPLQDLAVIKIETSNLPTVSLGDSASLELGQTAIAIGNALGEYRNTVSVGVVSGLSRTVTASDQNGNQETIQGVIQTDAAINPGNSGGPLLNSRGEVIGIDTAVAEGAQSIGFALPINMAKHDIVSVEKSGEIQIPYLGVRYTMITSYLAKSQKLAVDYGALIVGNKNSPAIQPNSPAEKAGLKAEDIILEVNGQEINQDHDLGDVVSQMNVGDNITLKINRAGKEITLKAVLEKRPSSL